MSSVKKFIGGKECECFEFQDPFHGDLGQMRMFLSGTFGQNKSRESVILVPLFFSESELETISDLWITEQERELDLPLGKSCSSSSWWAGSNDSSRDKEITDKYDFLVPVAISNHESQLRLQEEINSLYKKGSDIEAALALEYEDGETDWSAQLEVKLDDLERLVEQKEFLLNQAQLVTQGNSVFFNGNLCEVLNTRNNQISLWTPGSSEPVLVPVCEYLDSRVVLNNLKILSVEECYDKDYGNSVVQYQLGDSFVSFSYSLVKIEDAIADPSLLISELHSDPNLNLSRPVWSELSSEMRELILESCFDMAFVEYDDPDWSEDLAEQIWEEAKERQLTGAVRRGEDDCYLTVYAGAMGDVNWYGDPEYGVPCLHHVVEKFHMEQNVSKNTAIAKQELKITDHYALDENEMIFTVSLAPGYAVDVKSFNDSEFIYVMQNQDGSSVYAECDSEHTYPDYPFNESSVLKFVKEMHGRVGEKAKPSLAQQIQSAEARENSFIALNKKIVPER